MAVIGALVASRTGNPIGWLLLTIPFTLWLSQFAQDLADHGIPLGASYGLGADWLTASPGDDRVDRPTRSGLAGRPTSGR